MSRDTSQVFASAVRSRGELFCALFIIAIVIVIGIVESLGRSGSNEYAAPISVVDHIDFREDVFSNAALAQPFEQRLDGFSDEALDEFILGRSFFTIPWVVAPSATTARDGLGPLFNANACVSCHINNGAGLAIGNDGQPLRALTFKLAQPTHHHIAQKASLLNQGDPVYGRQVAINGNGSVKPEALPRLKHMQKVFQFPDGNQQVLTYFEPYLDNMNYGPLDSNTQLALRQAPTLAGLGFIAQVAQEHILEYADPDDRDGDGISGKPNWVYDIASGEMRLGKYGWKAGQPSITQQTADAAANDMGLTNPLFPEELCTSAQIDCLAAPRGRPSPFGTLDLPQKRLDAIAFYVASFKAPQPQALSVRAQEGRVLFVESGCASCHRQRLTTKNGVDFAAYSDYLLHDMGLDLADGRPEFDADVNEWRTAPLWGIGARVRAGQRFLHDARASTPLEAILWHGGEAENAKQHFAELSTGQRQSLLTFLESL